MEGHPFQTRLCPMTCSPLDALLDPSPAARLIPPPTDQPEMMRFENEKLRQELERLKKVLGPGPAAANEKLLHENALLVSQVRPCV